MFQRCKQGLLVAARDGAYAGEAPARDCSQPDTADEFSIVGAGCALVVSAIIKADLVVEDNGRGVGENAAGIEGFRVWAAGEK